jgi:Porin subfamily
MKLMRGLLLATPATLVAAAAAQAADLPAYKSAPIEYVRVCDAYGSGFFYIPGANTCLEVGGYARAEVSYTPGYNVDNPFAAKGVSPVSQVGGSQDTSGLEVRGRVDMDARTQTEWGTVQTVLHLRATTADGIRSVLGSTTQFQTAFTPVGDSATSITIEHTYIRFAGLTAGISSDNFSTMPTYLYSSQIYGGFPNGIKQLAYTATFGNGFSATLAAESKSDMSNNSVSGPANLNGVPTAFNSEYNNRWDTGYVLVGNARYDPNWGYAQINGAVTANSINGTTLGTAFVPTDPNTTMTAWAAGISFRYNLPFIAPGDQFHFQFAYTNGLLGEIMGSDSLNNAGGDATNKRVLGGVEFAPSNVMATAATPTGTVTSVGQTRAYGVTGIFTHYFTPQWRTNLELGYLQIYEPTAAASAGFQEGSGNVFEASGNLIWSPVKTFDIGVELDYIRFHSGVQNASEAGAGWIAAGEPGLAENGLDGILRLERQF